MLYLETPALPGRTAAQQLSPAVAALTQRAAPDTGAQASTQSTGDAQGAVHVSASHSNADCAMQAAADSVQSATKPDQMDSRPRLLMAAYYSQRPGTPSEVCSSTHSHALTVAHPCAVASSGSHSKRDVNVWTVDQGAAQPENVACCGGPDGSLDFDSALQAAERCFHRLFPDADASFLSFVIPGACPVLFCLLLCDLLPALQQQPDCDSLIQAPARTAMMNLTKTLLRRCKRRWAAWTAGNQMHTMKDVSACAQLRVKPLLQTAFVIWMSLASVSQSHWHMLNH